MIHTRPIALSALVGIVLITTLCQAQGVPAFTMPSDDVKLSFVRPGCVAEAPIKEGDAVNAGQILLRQDDSAEQEQLKYLSAEATNTTRVEAADAQYKQKQVALKLMQKANQSGAATNLEMEQAIVEELIAKLSWDLAKFEREQNQRKCDEAKAQIDRMRILSPFAGKVESLQIRRGESVDAVKPVIRVVRIDPLWVDVPAPIEQALHVWVGQDAVVHYAEEYSDTVTGKVIHVASVMDSASNTRRIRVELPNPKEYPAGLHVQVEFPRQQPPASAPAATTEPVTTTEPASQPVAQATVKEEAPTAEAATSQPVAEDRKEQ